MYLAAQNIPGISRIDGVVIVVSLPADGQAHPQWRGRPTMQLLPLTLLLLGALVLSMTFAHLQHRYYLREVNRLAAQYRQAGYVLTSGIARGRLRGAIAILVVRRDGDVIERATVMEGSSILARFRERGALHGQSLKALAQAPLSTAAKRALEDAAARYQQMFASPQHVEAEAPAAASSETSPAPGVAGA